MVSLVQMTARVAFANAYTTFVSEHISPPFSKSVYFPSLLYTPHLRDPNPNQLHFLLQTRNGTMQEAESKAQSGQSYFEVEWPITQRAINLASIEIGAQIKTDLDGGARADHLKSLVLKSLKIDSFEGYITDDDSGEQKKSDAETVLRHAIKLSASAAQAENLKALGCYREAAALFSRYGLNHAAAMAQELAWQTTMAIPEHARGQSWRKDVTDDHLCAAQFWQSTVDPEENHSSNALRRGLNNALKAEEYGAKLVPLIIEKILLASAEWFARQGDITKQTESLLYAIARQMHPLLCEQDLPLDEWTDVASVLGYVSKNIAESDYDAHLQTIKDFAESAYRFVGVDKGRLILQSGARLSIYSYPKASDPDQFKNLSN